MKVEEVLQCSLPAWYPQFEKVTFPTICLTLSGEVLDYLREDDQLVLPRECNEESYDGKEEDYEDFGDTDWSEDGESGDENQQKTFPEFSQNVLKVINDFGGEVFLKLNWSSPKDATWVAFNNSMKCTSLSQLYLLLKSSDFIAHDLSKPFTSCEDWHQEDQVTVSYSLVLRKWVDVNPGTEFRCWVASGQLVAICQRDTSNYYPHLAREEDSIKQDIVSFFQEQIRDKFPLEHFVMDVTRPRKDNVVLVDFNPWGDTTDSLMFSWEELDEQKDGEQETCVRYIRESGGVQPHPYRHYSIPRDMVDLASGTDPYKLMDFLKLKEQTETGEVDSDQE
eukprot:TRINITY_DN27706_c0_g1_i8.p1 TRINITY_DN27706_c0_g1~~TRINITY_DN27706_c0_g1_i8.p1  ORF type:complete len:336 (-),score=132.00 TRINITY_DN27706_c0_g1_i8:64-1071(-)